MDALPQIPVIDLWQLDGPQHDQMVEKLVKAAEMFGFIQVVNHGIPVEFLEELRDSVHSFHTQPEEKKAEITPSSLVVYEPHPVSEARQFLFMSYTNENDALKYWPHSCKEVALKYLKTSSKLTEKVLGILMSNLGVTLDESMADAYMGGKTVLMNYYPACLDQVITTPGTRKHTDFGTLTVLLQCHIGGLFGKLKEDGDMENNYKGEWVEIKPIPGALTILVGDSLQVLSNGKYKSGEHYVQTNAGREARVSFIVFMNPRLTTKVRPLPQVVVKDGGKARYKEFLLGEYKDYAMSFESTDDIKCIDSVLM